MEYISKEKFQYILNKICSTETSVNPESWTAKNPYSGHCAVVALLAQLIFGGKIVRISLENNIKFKHFRSHYFNVFSDQSLNDFTGEQFGDHYPMAEMTTMQTRSRENLFANEDTKKRWQILAIKFFLELTDNPLFNDSYYQQCFFKATESDCQKMKFGSIITHKGITYGCGQNKTIEPLAHICQGHCIRLNIQSRTESMIGSCGHAEEWAIWDAVSKNIVLKECDIYIAGFYTNGLPWIKDEITHTCLRCATQMWYAGFKNVFVPVNNKWESLNVDEAIKTASEYALQSKIVKA